MQISERQLLFQDGNASNVLGRSGKKSQVMARQGLGAFVCCNILKYMI
jgi:hypothetical protein